MNRSVLYAAAEQLAGYDFPAALCRVPACRRSGLCGLPQQYAAARCAICVSLRPDDTCDNRFCRKSLRGLRQWPWPEASRRHPGGRRLYRRGSPVDPGAQVSWATARGRTSRATACKRHFNPTSTPPTWSSPFRLHASRRRERGYNQAELLARAFATPQGLPVRTDVLIRARATEAQTHLSQRGASG